MKVMVLLHLERTMHRSKKSSLSRDELKQKCIQDIQSMEVHRDTIKTLVDDLKDTLIEQRAQGKTVQALARQLERTLGQTMENPPALSYLIRQISAVTAPAFRKEKTSDPTAATAARVLPGRPAAAVQKSGAGATAGRSALEEARRHAEERAQAGAKPSRFPPGYREKDLSEL
jgi:hypothetical protein